MGATQRSKMTERAQDGAASEHGLCSLKLIESVGELEPFEIVLIAQRCGAALSAEEAMTAKVRWAQKAGYNVLTSEVPRNFWPYNAIIRVDAAGTEDQRRDYLAQIADEPPSVAS